MRIIGYVRESTKKQMKFGYNKDDQVKKIIQFAEIYYPGEAVEILIEDGRSGRSLNRKQMKYLLSEIRFNRVDVVIFHNLDRFVRNLEDLIHLLKLFIKYEIEFKSVMEMFDINSPSGREYILSTGLRAQSESEHTSSRTIRGIKEGISQGYYTISHVPEGYKRKKEDYRKLEINPEVVDEIVYAFELGQDKNRSYKSIAKKLNEKYKTDKWYSYKVRRTLDNKLYYGHMSYRGLEIDDFCDAIITKETYDKCHTFNRRVTRSKMIYRYYFRNKCRCVKCDNELIHKSSQSKSKHYNYYYCPVCNNRINQDDILKLNSDVFKNITKQYMKEHVSVDISKRINEINNGIKELKDILFKDGSNKQFINDKIEILRNKRRQLVKKKKQLIKDEFYDLKTSDKLIVCDIYISSVDVTFLKRGDVKVKVNLKG